MSAAPHASRQVPAPKDRAKIISAIKKLVPERHINVSNPNQDYRPWIALVDERMPRLIELDDAQAFESGVGELLRALGSSHTAFFHQRRDSVPAPYSINATLRAVDTSQGKRWMFLDVIEDGPTFQAGIHPGELLLSIDSEPVIPPTPANFRIGGSHQLEIGTFGGDKRQVVVEVPNRAAKDRPPMIEPRSLSHRMLASDTGLVRVATFPGAVGQSFARDLDAAVRDLKDRSMVPLTEGLGPQPFHGRTVVLINEHSHSAAEMVASFAKENHLATLVGTRTAGEVLGGANFKLPGGYVLRMPVAGWYTWNGECIEGKGVEPDVPIENSPESLTADVDIQLQAGIEVV